MQVVGVVVLVAIVVGWWKYGNWLQRGVQRRSFETSVPRATLQQLFATKVAHAGWRIVDDGNPMIAQSSLATGVRQQIGLSMVDAGNGRTRVEVGPARWVTKGGVPKKGHTIRMRLDGFVNGVRSHDPGIQVTVVGNR